MPCCAWKPKLSMFLGISGKLLHYVLKDAKLNLANKDKTKMERTNPIMPGKIYGKFLLDELCLQVYPSLINIGPSPPSYWNQIKSPPTPPFPNANTNALLFLCHFMAVIALPHAMIYVFLFSSLKFSFYLYIY